MYTIIYVFSMLFAWKVFGDHFSYLYYGNQLIFEQCFHFLREGRGLYSPIEAFYVGFEAKSHSAAHFQPILYVLAPISWLFPSTRALLFLTAVVMFSGWLPLWLIAKRVAIPKTGDFSIWPLIVPIIFLCDWTLTKQSRLEFFPLNFSIPIYLWALWAWLSRRNRLLALAVAAALSLKETEGLTVIGLGLLIMTDKETRRTGLVVLLAGVAWTVATFGFVIPAFAEGHGYAFSRLYSGDGGGSALLVRLFSPGNYLLLVSILLRFTPLIVFAPQALIPAAPALGGMLLSGMEIHKDPAAHQGNPAIPFLYVAMILGIQRIQWKVPVEGQKFFNALFSALLCLLVPFTWYLPRTYSKVYSVYNEAAYPPLREDRDNMEFWSRLDVLPPGSIVSADLVSLPKVFETCPEIYQFPWQNERIQYYVAQVGPADLPWMRGGLLDAMGKGFLPLHESWREGFYVLGKDPANRVRQEYLDGLRHLWSDGLQFSSDQAPPGQSAYQSAYYYKAFMGVPQPGLDERHQVGPVRLLLAVEDEFVEGSLEITGSLPQRAGVARCRVSIDGEDVALLPMKEHQSRWSLPIFRPMIQDGVGQLVLTTETSDGQFLQYFIESARLVTPKSETTP